MPGIERRNSDSSLIELDADARLTHYRLQKVGEHKLDLATGEVVKLKPVAEAGIGNAMDEEKVRLAEPPSRRRLPEAHGCPQRVHPIACGNAVGQPFNSTNGWPFRLVNGR